MPGAMRRFSATLALLLCAVCVSAHSTYWVKPLEPRAENGVPKCLQLPNSPEGAHSGPVLDKDTTLSLFEGERLVKTTTQLCKGHTYTGKINFPAEGKEREAVLVATAGQLSGAESDEGCEGHRVFWHKKALQSTFKLTVPEFITETELVLKLVSADGKKGAFQRLQVTFTVGECSAAELDAQTTRRAALSRRKLQQNRAANATKCAPLESEGANCAPSELGYSCKVTETGPGSYFVMHYSLGGCPPKNPCTEIARMYANASKVANESILHLYGTAQGEGYISLGFAKTPNKMEGTDAPFAFQAEGESPKLYVFPLKHQVRNDAKETLSLRRYLAYFGFVQSGGNVTMCFGRFGNVSAGGRANIQALDFSKPVEFTWAVGNRMDIGTHSADEQGRGGFSVALATGGAKGGGPIVDELDVFRIAHGALLLISWAFLVPFAILAMKHKWFFTQKLIGAPAWFNLHRFANVLAILLTTIACIIAYIKLDLIHEPYNTGMAHKVLGILVFCFMWIQALLAFQPVRPSKDDPSLGGKLTRKLWNYIHWWLGRFTLLLSIITMFIGIYQFNAIKVGSKGPAAYAYWLAPSVVVLSLIIIADIVLTILAPQPDPPIKQASPSVDHLPVDTSKLDLELPIQNGR